MSLLSTSLASEVGLRLLLSPLGSKIFARWACFVSGVAFPVYSSFKAIEADQKLEQRQWLHYWIAYGCFTSVEAFSDKFLSWFPGYYHVKLLFLVWLQLPLSNGSSYLLSNYLCPLLTKYEGLLDGVVNGTRSDINNFLIAHMHELNFIKAFLFRMTLRVFTALKEIQRTLNSSSFVQNTNENGESSSTGTSNDTPC